VNLLLDHCLDWRLSRALPGHTVKAVGKLGWSHLKDRPLLTKAQAHFDVLITSDKNLPYQQKLSRFRIAVVILDVPSNRIEDCLPKMPSLLAALPRLVKGRATVV
jgi:predicted nuclease of predicted toxin-antitoxin system